MGKLSTTIFIIFTLAISNVSAQQEPNDSSGDIRYITDDLSAFMHTGPTRNYRILGSITAGTRITVLQENKETGFTEVIDDKQRTGWVESQYVSNEQSIRELVPGLQQSAKQSTSQIAQLNKSNDLLSQQLSDLTSQNKVLVKDLESQKKETQKLQRELDMLDQSAQMKWFTRGGIIALVSILLGVIIAYLPKKRKRSDQWM
ncbi:MULTISPECIES: TIGR04211 family SH3 domain-containing protein [Alteromonadaceae]|uniref:TIGR04211 family SH3 domain-containing protein n=1 Tax=Alteromonadaceae TaxID=72275 RepID=UPI001C09CD60|nr:MULTISPECIES: TIGR04211 family SH3 domain-containing protein [Aliiglaciecola]MBU2878769.1 TIGR04211 family SH3 domain-containing protein [Aliiglaciecola lipolytica]MDO6711333.1 TIGR04211 family SH3 domain-containing protein [Aliiglaciecola sp. 2_MG-2023]MDO6752218.1 TIGR04211 family SH3 domain-containing protein [Aliiglaciecola sp. 1_MG-2023]